MVAVGFKSLIENRTFRLPDLPGCWLWTGDTKNGYGRGCLGGRYFYAHRMSWEFHNDQSIPGGMCVCHRCDTPLCVRPDHLFIGTRADNTRDTVKKNRHARGIAHAAKLTERDVVAIRSDGRSSSVVCHEFGVSESLIRQIRRRAIWRSLA